MATVLLPAVRARTATASFTLGAARTGRNGKALQLHGLGIVKVGSTWYGFGEARPETAGSSSAASESWTLS